MRETLEVFPVAIHFLKHLSSKRPTAPGCRGTGLQEKAFPEVEAVILRHKMTTIGRICVSCSLCSWGDASVCTCSYQVSLSAVER